MCDDCHRVEAKDFWRAVVQVRQKVNEPPIHAIGTSEYICIFLFLHMYNKFLLGNITCELEMEN